MFSQISGLVASSGYDIVSAKIVTRSDGYAVDTFFIQNKDKKPLNKEGLRYENELMRHKVLEVVGDLYLSGYPIIGNYKGFKTGHYITINLLKKLFNSKDNYKIHKIN